MSIIMVGHLPALVNCIQHYTKDSMFRRGTSMEAWEVHFTT